MTNSSLTSTKA